MAVRFTTITQKGQITLPAAVRRELGLRSGQKVAVRVEGERVVIDAPQSLATIRARIRAEAEARGTWGDAPHSGDGWAERALDFDAEP